VRLEFSKEGGDRFEAYTAAHIKRRFAILVDGKVMSAPVIQTRIPGGVATITMGAGDPDQQRADAKKLVEALVGR
jgi:preprotein translocase subunit SecD